MSKASASSEINSISDADNEKDYRNGSGYILDGPEYYTVFNGLTGAAIDTIEYPVPRGNLNLWGDTYGNRVDRYLGGIAYLDGVHPSIIAWRGYYARTTAAGITLENGRLNVGNIFIAESNKQFSGQGNHNLTVADVDNDGKDEVICGGLALDDNLTPLWSGGRGHGDALHIGDYDPTHKGLEYFTVHESGGYKISGSTNGKDGSDADYGMTVYDAATGEELAHYGAGGDTGRGVMANIGAGGNYQITSKAGTFRSDDGSNFTAGNYGMSQNFRIFWDEDLYDELLDGTGDRNCSIGITSWDDSQMKMNRIFTTTGVATINDTKNNPCLQADILGDWREEVIARTSDNNKLRVYMTTTPTDYKIKTLMHDPVYRSGVAAEQTAYNQPPHVGFYMADSMFIEDTPTLEITGPTKKRYVIGEQLDTEGLVVKATYPDGTVEDDITGYTLSELDSSSPGEKEITVSYKGADIKFTVTVVAVADLELTQEPAKTEYVQGEQLDLTDMKITVTYSDNETEVIENNDIADRCEISGFNPSTVGEQHVTVSYGGKPVTFTVTVREASVEDLNRDYENASTTQTTTSVHISPFTGAYVLEHTFTINTMPAAGNINNKGTVSGFTLRFMSDATDNVKEGTGGGWTLVPNSDKTAADVYWKSGSNDAARLTTNAPIKLGETYTVRYAFTDVATGNGARVKMYVIDSNGNTVMEQGNLDLRNFTNDNQKAVAINRIDITMQAASNDAPAGVTIGDAKVTLCGVVYVDGKKVSVNLNNDSEVNSVRAYAVKYANGALTNVTDVTPKAPGELVSTLSFEPDKIYVWSDMQPLSLWSKAE